jgi:hypothetical protein
MTRQARLSATLADNRRSLEQTLRICARPTGDRIADRILAGIASRARSDLKALSKAERNPVLASDGFDDLGHWGVNGLQPAIQDMLRDAQFHAGYAQQEAA